jgi:hypothetical protein
LLFLSLQAIKTGDQAKANQAANDAAKAAAEAADKVLKAGGTPAAAAEAAKGVATGGQVGTSPPDQSAQQASQHQLNRTRVKARISLPLLHLQTRTPRTNPLPLCHQHQPFSRPRTSTSNQHSRVRHSPLTPRSSE